MIRTIQHSNKPHIYLITNLINGKKYVGQTIGNDPTYICGGKIIRLAIRKYGIENFSREVLIEGDFSNEQLDELEAEYIIKCESLLPNGYNISPTGTGRKITRQEPWNKGGGKYTPEMIQKMSDAKKGKIVSEETKKKMSEAAKGKPKSPRVGESSKQRFSKPVLQFDLEDNFVAEYPSASQAAIEVGSDFSTIAAACRGRFKTAAKFKWKYKENI